MELEKLQKFIESQISDNIIHSFVAIPKTKQMIVNICDDNLTKNLFIKEFKEYCSKNNITEFFLYSEAWIVASTDKFIMPSESPDREEIAMLAKHSLTGNEVYRANIYGEEGSKRFLGEWTKLEFSGASSIWDECLQKV